MSFLSTAARCAKYLKTTSLICGIDEDENVELARTICNENICKEERGHFFGYCDNINTLIDLVGQENIAYEVEGEEANFANNNQNNAELKMIRKTGSFNGVKYASLYHVDDAPIDVIPDNPVTVNCFCCTQLA